jgi:hypothetical protein
MTVGTAAEHLDVVTCQPVKEKAVKMTMPIHRR